VGGTIAATTLAACIKSGRPFSECAIEAGINVAAVPPSQGSIGGDVAAGGAIAGEIAFFTCLSEGGSFLQCLGTAIKAGATASLCAAIGATNPVLGAVCGPLIDAGREGIETAIAILEANHAIDEEIRQAERNFTGNTDVFIRRVSGIEAKIRQFENDTGPVLEGVSESEQPRRAGEAGVGRHGLRRDSRQHGRA
jgi:hypothetical protein